MLTVRQVAEWLGVSTATIPPLWEARSACGAEAKQGGVVRGQDRTACEPNGIKSAIALMLERRKKAVGKSET
jgi:hypothetical protein